MSPDHERGRPFRSDGAINVVWDEPGLLGAAYLSIDGGGLLEIDPATLEIQRLSIREPAFARPTLRRLLGEEALEALERFRTTGESDSPIARLSAVTGDPLLSLGFSLWWSRWTPLPVSRERAAMDVALTAFRAGRTDVSAQALLACASSVADLAMQVGQHDALPARLRDELLALVEAASSVLGQLHPQWAAFRGLHDSLVAVGTQDGDPALIGSDARQPQASAAGADSAPGHQTLSIELDWPSLPPRVLDPATVRVRLEGQAGGYLLSLPAHPFFDGRSEAADGLRGAVVREATGETISSSALIFHRSQHAFTTWLPVPSDVVDPVLVVIGQFGVATVTRADVRRQRAVSMAVWSMARARQEAASAALRGVQLSLDWMLDVSVDVAQLLDEEPRLLDGFRRWSGSVGRGETSLLPPPLLTEMLQLVLPESAPSAFPSEGELLPLVAVAATTDGDLHVGRPPRGRGAVYFPVLGGVMGVQVDDDLAIPFSAVSDPVAAAWWLELVYGEAVALAVAEIAEELRGESGPDERVPLSQAVPVTKGPLFPAAVRFGVGSWIDRWWPSSDAAPVPLDQTKLNLELGVLAWTLEFLFGGLGAASARLAEAVAPLTELARNDSVPDDNLLRPALRATLESVPLPPETAGELAKLEQAIIALGTSRPDLSDAGLTDVLRSWGREERRVVSPRRRIAMVARGGNSVARHFPVAIDLCPPRSLSWSERAIEVTLTLVDQMAQAVMRVQAGDQAPGAQLFGRLYLDDDSTPVSVGELALGPDGYYSCEMRFSLSSLPGDLTADVFTSSLLAPHDPERSHNVRMEVMRISEAIARGSHNDPPDASVDELAPDAPWRALRRG